MKLLALCALVLSAACAGPDLATAPTYHRAEPLVPVATGPSTDPTDWRSVPAGAQFTGLQSYQACKDSCPGAAGLEFYAASDDCICTCADGSWVESHPYDRTIADELAAEWKAVCR